MAGLRDKCEIFQGNLRAPILGTWKISNFTAIERTPGKENLFSFNGDVEKNSEGGVTTGYLLILNILEV